MCRRLRLARRLTLQRRLTRQTSAGGDRCPASSIAELAGVATKTALPEAALHIARLFRLGGPEFRHSSYRSRNSAGILPDGMSRWTVGGETSDRNSNQACLHAGMRAICDKAATWRMLVTPHFGQSRAENRSAA